ncbi:MAG: hypothetical protein HRU43_00235 [Simkaniaceae bacterium]|nr:hypothetical protein [Simkaniaceae bacterium]
MKQKIYEHFRSSWKTYIPLIAFGFLSTKVDASAVERMTASTNSLSGLVKGPLGEAALIVGSLGGAFGAFMKGNMWLAIGIFMVGMLFSWHLENITAMFPGGE